MSVYKCSIALLSLILLSGPLLSQGIDSKDPSIAILLGDKGRREHDDLLKDSGETWAQSLAWGEQLFFAGQAIDPPSKYESEEIHDVDRFLNESPNSPLREFLRGKQSVHLSEHLSSVTKFTCNRCHNLTQEDTFLPVQDPEKRYELIFELKKASAAKVLMTPSPTLWGAVNREDFYLGPASIYRELLIPNFIDEAVDEYDVGALKKAIEIHLKKPEGDVTRENSDMEQFVKVGAAVHICGSYCSKGKKDPSNENDFFLKPWEYRALMTLLWENELKLSNLKLGADALHVLKVAPILLKEDPTDIEKELIDQYRKFLKSRILTKAVATERQQDINDRPQGDSQRGEKLYSVSCALCHPRDGSRSVGPLLQPNVIRQNEEEFYQRVRELKIESAVSGPYMPGFTLERLSTQQLEDIKAFLLGQ